MAVTTLSDLLAEPGVTEQCELRGRFGFMAFHGGALEEMTDVIASRAAAAAGASYYGVLQPDTLLVHLPSIQFTADQSPQLARYLAHVDTVITVHGFGRRQMMTSVLLGGRNRALAAHLAAHLRAALPAYEIVDELERIPTELQGIHDRNPVNVPRHAGVQLELPPRVRGASALWLDFEGDLTPHTAALVDALVDAARSWSTPNGAPAASITVPACTPTAR